MTNNNNTAAPDALAKARETVENVMEGVRSYRDQHGGGVTPPDVLASLARRAEELYALASVVGDKDAVRLANDAWNLAQLDHPVIRADNGDLETMAKDSWHALARYNEPAHLFLFGGMPVRFERGDGAPILRPLTENRMRHELARAATWVRGKQQTPASPPMGGVRDLLASSELELPKLERIVEVPVFGPSGELVSAPGYNAATATYYAQPDGLVMPDVPERPTAARVVAACTLIVDELLGDFPFTGDAEQAHAVTLLLQPFVRALIDGPTPLHLIEKPTPGTGASLLADVVALPANGRPLPTMTEARDEDEWRKRVTATLLGSPSHVLIDNLRRPLDSAAVSAALTTLVWTDRVLGASEMRSIPVTCAWVATGNNPRLSGEITRRSVRIRLDAHLDRPQFGRDFRHRDLLVWATAHRGELIAAALVLCRAWVAAGKPSGGGPLLGSYESWSKVMGGILMVAGVRGFGQPERVLRLRRGRRRLLAHVRGGVGRAAR